MLPLRIPEALDAVQAKVVTTWDGGRVGEDVQADAALELILQRNGKGHVCDWKKNICVKFLRTYSFIVCKAIFLLLKQKL